MTPDVLNGLAGEVVIERLDSAAEVVADMAGVQHLDPEGRRHFVPAIKRLSALGARFMAGASGGGFSNG